MNVATRLKLEQMERDIKELKQIVATLSESLAYLQGEQVGRRLDQQQIWDVSCGESPSPIEVLAATSEPDPDPKRFSAKPAPRGTLKLEKRKLG